MAHSKLLNFFVKVAQFRKRKESNTFAKWVSGLINLLGLTNAAKPWILCGVWGLLRFCGGGFTIALQNKPPGSFPLDI